MADKKTTKSFENVNNSNNKETRSSKKHSGHVSFNSRCLFSHIGSLVLGILLLALLIRYSQNQFNPILPTFTNLLEKFSTSEVATVPFVSFSSLTLGDWGAFNFLQVFIESIVSIFNVLLFFVNGIISAISYLVWFMQWLFIG